MSNQAFLTIFGLYKYNQDIFDDMVIPEGIDKETLLNEIFIKCSNMSLVYPDYDFMKLAIKNWSKSELDIWNRLYQAFTEEYNPLWNVDGTTTETRSISREGTENTTNSNSLTGADTRVIAEKGSKTNDITLTTNNTTNTTGSTTSNTQEVSEGTSSTTSNTTTSSTTTNSIKGFNSNDWVDHDKSVANGTDNNTTSVSTTGKVSTDVAGSTTNNETLTGRQVTDQDETSQSNTNDTLNRTETNSGTGSRTNEETVTETFTQRRQGNIGVTMSQELLEAELKVRPKLNIYDYIADSFKKKFIIMIY